MPKNISTLCSLLGYSRQALYQGGRQQQQQAYKEALIIQQVQMIRLTQKRLGGRKLLGLLGNFFKEHKISIGRDAFFNLLCRNGLLVRRRKRSKPITTDSVHHFRKYKNIVKGFTPMAANQLWVSDITYIPLAEGFGYLSLITDAYSRKIVGFDLHPTLGATGSVKALKMALLSLPAHHNIIHHSDRGIQYCSNEYVRVLNKNNITISMTENGDPLENAIAERINGILKQEFLEAQYSDFQAAQTAITRAINIYNYQRPHSSVDYLTPVAAHQQTGRLTRRWKNYYNKKEVAMAEP
ncbi:IS3 family transposase [Niabella sp. CC-SYL272]|uniref:IS3 family transposase n=1 Tax=Niabella agricola TaxID=2891571 RepID=UPI001F404314|nr:IS3 family transposase [Niabella agricola]MCF3109240.1 IS3 family transposase [Niabella agricola]MCF3110434.1 IS3 family transposase [Niabella agricola]